MSNFKACIEKLEYLKSTSIHEQKVRFKKWERIYRRPDRPDIKDVEAYHCPGIGTIWIENRKYKFEGTYFKTLKEAMIAAEIHSFEKRLKELSLTC